MFPCKNRFQIALIPLLLLNFFLLSCKTQNLFVAADQKDRIDSTFRRTTLDYEYVIRKSDKISISVWDNDDASVGSTYGIYNSNEVYGKWLMVDTRGEINVPRIGSLRVLGLTVVAAEDTLRNRYAQWIKKPIVDLKVLNKEVVVMGEMKGPGKFLLEKDDNNLVELLARAGDFDFYADKRRVQVIRVENGQVHKLSIDLTHMDNYFAGNIRIIPGDIIYVPAKKGKDFDKRVSTVVPFVSMVTAFVIICKAFF